jgi:hypothetical protein
MTKTIVIAGKKQSGKSSLANFLYGFYLTKGGILQNFTVDDDGKLIVPSVVVDETGQETFGQGILDLQTPSPEVFGWASKFVYPYVKDYAFANSLKQTCMGLFDLTYEQCYGTDEEKNTPSKIKWAHMYRLMSVKDINALKKEGKYDPEKNMSSREVLQYFGTNVCRVLYDNIWIDRVFTQIGQENTKLAIVTDCRYKNEVLAAKETGAKIVKLDKKKFEDNHSSETDLDDLPPETFDLIIPNQEMTIKEKNLCMYEGLVKWGWLNILEG